MNENNDSVPDPALDALVTIGRMVRGASKSFWRQLKSKDGHAKAQSSSEQTRDSHASGPRADWGADDVDPDADLHADDREASGDVDEVLMFDGPAFTEALNGVLSGTVDVDGAAAEARSSRTLSDVGRYDERSSAAMRTSLEIRRSASLSTLPSSSERGHAYVGPRANANIGRRSTTIEIADEATTAYHT